MIDSVDKAGALFMPILRHARDERLFIAHLDAGRHLIGMRIRFGTSETSVCLPVRAIVSDAISLGTAGLILAHNHPSGDPRPSGTDIKVTRDLVQLVRQIGVGVLDHLIFGGGRMVSFSEAGLL